VDVLDILDTVSRDAEIYFGVIASSHLVVVIMFAAARVRLFAPALKLLCAYRWVHFPSPRYGPYPWCKAS
jgi:hypothetical protein